MFFMPFVCFSLNHLLYLEHTHTRMHAHSMRPWSNVIRFFFIAFSHYLCPGKLFVPGGRSLPHTDVRKARCRQISTAHNSITAKSLPHIYSQPQLSLSLSLSLSDALHPRYTKIARAADVSRYGGYCNPWKHHVSLPLEISSAFIIFIYVLRQILHKLCHGESARIYMCLLSLVWA